MYQISSTLLWLRRDLRLADHPALTAALARGGAIIPVFIRDDTVDGLGAAPKWRLGLSLESLARSLEQVGSRLVLRSGPAQQVLDDLLQETGAGAVYWSRLYDPEAIARDSAIKQVLKSKGIEAASFNAHLLFEPWSVQTGTGGFYKVYSPFWKAVRDRDVPSLDPAPQRLEAPVNWPKSEDMQGWNLASGMHRGAEVVLPYQRIGEKAASDRLAQFLENAVAGYQDGRNQMANEGTSGLSENLSLGEISVRQCWHVAQRAHAQGAAGAETWMKELVWREFAYHLMYHTPHILSRSWKAQWDHFPWGRDVEHPYVKAWMRGRTGVPLVDAAMRELYVTGRMHNRARMITASYLTKHLMTDWRIGQQWFAECLTDWDPASNAMGWQWVAGCGPDAAPYFRIFNPETQAKTYDPAGAYRSRWIAEGSAEPAETALSYFRAIPRHWRLSARDIYPEPVVGLSEGRAGALRAFEELKAGV